MEPTYYEGDRLVVYQFFFFLKEGNVVVARHPYKHILIVKRIKKITPKGYVLAGDNAQETTDSEAFGAIARRDIVGKVLFRYR